MKEGLFYLFPLSEWQAAPTLANSLLQLDNTLQPKSGRDTEMNDLRALLFTNSPSAGHELPPTNDGVRLEDKKTDISQDVTL